MEAKDHNYGVAGDEVAEEQGPVTGERGPVTMGTQEEKTMSVLAHLSIFLNLVTGFLGPVAALIIWLVYRDRSSNVGFQAL
ncbi:MAG TPA: DUF4870 domain-containing protein, partial [Rubrobacter sp.]|nr:DUF4870 domain-containing protein [Rubrobacter sp.]